MVLTFGFAAGFYCVLGRVFDTLERLQNDVVPGFLARESFKEVVVRFILLFLSRTLETFNQICLPSAYTLFQ